MFPTLSLLPPPPSTYPIVHPLSLLPPPPSTYHYTLSLSFPHLPTCHYTLSLLPPPPYVPHILLSSCSCLRLCPCSRPATWPHIPRVVPRMHARDASLLRHRRCGPPRLPYSGALDAAMLPRASSRNRPARAVGVERVSCTCLAGGREVCTCSCHFILFLPFTMVPFSPHVLPSPSLLTRRKLTPACWGRRGTGT